MAPIYPDPNGVQVSWLEAYRLHIAWKETALMLEQQMPWQARAIESCPCEEMKPALLADAERLEANHAAACRQRDAWRDEARRLDPERGLIADRAMGRAA